MNLGELFPLVFCVNMHNRPDRWGEARQEISKLDIIPQRLEGIIFTGSIGKNIDRYIGCGLAHMEGFKIAGELNENVLMFEDDVEFLPGFRENVQAAIDELPDDWDMFYLGANVCKKIYRVSPHIGKLTHAQATHAYGINKRFIPKLLEMEPRFQREIMDLMYSGEVIPQNNCYITIPMVAIQRNGFSDIEGEYREFGWMIERFEEQLR